MERNYLVLTVIIVSCVLFSQLSCQDQGGTTSKSETVMKSPPQETDSAETEAILLPDELGSEIVFEKVYHNFGDVGADTIHLCEFEFANAGNGVLRIGKIQSTCDCVVPELDKREYTSGDGGVIKIEYHSGKRLGPVTRVLYVPSNDKSKPAVKLAVVANVIAAIDYEPKTLKLSVKDENAGCPRITIHSQDNKAFAISDFKSTGDCITLDYDQSVEKTEFVLEPKVSMARLKSNLKGNITISLTHPEYNTVYIPYNAQPRFQLGPPAIMIFGPKPQKPIRREVWVHNNYGEYFEIESALPEKNMIKVLSQQKVGDRYKLMLEIEMPATDKEQTEFTDVLLINIKGGKKLQLPCKWRFIKE
jgi:hypothetical protein